jgi:L-threonylcarbamoyladenylate synthase
VVAIDPDGDVALLRPGAVAVEALEDRIGPVRRTADSPLSPGTLPSHYAPGVPLYVLPRPVASLTSEELAALPRRGVAYLRVLGPVEPAARVLGSAGIEVVTSRTLSGEGSAGEAARSLFAALRALDRPDIACVLAELPPTEEGLLAAIADRIRRAAGPREGRPAVEDDA